MTANEILNMVYNDNAPGTFAKPLTLVHYVGGNGGNGGNDLGTVELVRRNGLRANYGGWDDINELLANRPQGIFFWSAEDNVHGNANARIEVKVADLDTSKLWAYPNELAQAADHIICGREGIEGVIEAMKLARPVSYADYNGAFAAEWIYTEDIEPSKIN